MRRLGDAVVGLESRLLERGRRIMVALRPDQQPEPSDGVAGQPEPRCSHVAMARSAAMLQREGVGGGVRRGSTSQVESKISAALRPIPRRRRWFLAVLEEAIGLFREEACLLVSLQDAR